MAQTQLSANDTFLINALKRNRAMATTQFSTAGNLIDIELDEVPGYAHSIGVNVSASIDVNVPTGGTVPAWSEFFPYNLFSNYQISLGGGPFHNVSPYFIYLRNKAMGRGWEPGNQGPVNYGYNTTTTWNVPALSGTVGSTVTNTVLFHMEIPLQIAHGTAVGHVPFGDGKTKVHLRLTVASALYGADHYLNPINGGAGAITATVTPPATKVSYVQPNIHYRTTPADGTKIPTPQIGYLLNVQEMVTPLSVAGSWIPIKFPDPFRYLRLWHIVIDSTGAPNSTIVTGFRVNLTPGYPKENYENAQALQDYFNNTESLFHTSMPNGVLVWDGWSGSDPANPNGTQTIDGAKFSTLNTEIQVSGSTGSNAKIITYAEALAPVAF